MISHEGGGTKTPLTLWLSFFATINERGIFKMNKVNVREMIFAAFCVAMGLVFPSIFHLFGGTGPVFLPMHIPVLICGFACGYRYGALCGFIVPLLSSVLTGMPPIFPIGLAMALELMTYGLLTGMLKDKTNVYVSLIGAMIGGRVISGIANAFLLGMAGKTYGLSAFIAGAFVTALPGIILQLIAVPILVKAFEKSGIIKVRESIA